jgi:hypothetical protein
MLLKHLRLLRGEATEAIEIRNLGSVLRALMSRQLQCSLGSAWRL